MFETQPWANCLLSYMLIRHLETQYPEAANQLDYQHILSAGEVIQDIPDPRIFLSDPTTGFPTKCFTNSFRIARGQQE